MGDQHHTGALLLHQIPAQTIVKQMSSHLHIGHIAKKDVTLRGQGMFTEWAQGLTFASTAERGSSSTNKSARLYT